jgi:hypothetical protein
MLSVCYKGIALPVSWALLPKRGNSNRQERKKLLNQYIEFFGTASIDSFMANREFIGGNWFEELIQCQIPFYSRIRGI